jgi:uncharacterized membrane protein
MRSLQVQVRSRHAQRVLRLAEAHGARFPISLRAESTADDDGSDGWSVVLANLPNDAVGSYVEAVSAEADEARFTLLPVGALPLTTPPGRVDEAVRDVSTLSAMEVVVASLQSVGAWTGMLVYSALAGLVAGYGLIFDVTYLLVAAMLINPMGAPAVVAVVGMAVGDRHMFARGGLRFLVSLLVQAAAALALGFAYGLTVSTAAMELVTALSIWAALLAVAAGAAGAQSQLKSERDSLVSGTAAGFMVAAALAPPAAVMGLSVAVARWDYLLLMAFLLLLQFVGIAAGGWIAAHALGMRPGAPGTGRGSALWRTVLVCSALAVLAGMVWLQTNLDPRFTRADLSRTALEIAGEAVEDTDGAYLVESSARFTRTRLDRYPGDALLFEIVVERSDRAGSDYAIETEVREHVRRRVAARMSDVTPFVRVTVLPGPRSWNVDQRP